MKKLRLFAAAGSNCGKASVNNNSFYFDSFFPETDQIQYPMLVSTSNTTRNINLFGVFDGHGDREHAGYASYTAAKNLKSCHDNLFCETAPYWDGVINDFSRQLSDQVEQLNSQYQSDVGVDMAILGCDGRHIRVYGSGSCSVFMLRNGKLSRLTADFSHSSAMPRSGGNEYSNIAGDGLSVSVRPVSCISKFTPQKNDLYLICTSGIDSWLDPYKIKSILSQKRSDKELVNSLIQSAIDEGASDNITAIVVRVDTDLSVTFLGSKRGGSLISLLLSLIIILSIGLTIYGLYLYGKNFDNDFAPYAFFFSQDSSENQEDYGVLQL